MAPRNAVIIDDEPDVTTYFETLLADNGWNVRTAYNNRGVMHIAQGDYLTAIEDFESAAGKRPSGLTKRHLLQARNRIDLINNGTRVADTRSSDIARVE